MEIIARTKDGFLVSVSALEAKHIGQTETPEIGDSFNLISVIRNASWTIKQKEKLVQLQSELNQAKDRVESIIEEDTKNGKD